MTTKTFFEILQDKDRKIYSTPICGSPLYQLRDIKETLKEWLEQKRRELKSLKFVSEEEKRAIDSYIRIDLMEDLK